MNAPTNEVGLDHVPMVLVTLNLTWLSDWENKEHISLRPLQIDAPADVVWQLVVAVEGYESISGGLVRAWLQDGENGAKKIHVGIHPPGMGFAKRVLLADSLANSVEDVIVHAEQRALGWTREVPLSDSEVSQRWQVVVPSSDTQCVLYSGLRLPSSMAGSLAMWMTGDEVRACFVGLAEGIKRVAEAKAKSETTPTTTATTIVPK
jgi:hypothetical protein